MIPTEMLKEDHRRVDRLFKKVKDTTPSEHPALFEQIKAELDVHTHIEETAFYPTLLKNGKKDLQDITREGLEEHAQAKTFLEELSGLTTKNKQYEAKLKVLMEDIEHHVKEEEDTMFPLVEDQFSEPAQEKMTAAMKSAKAKFIKTMKPDEQKALERSIEGAKNEKGPIGKMYEKAKDAVTGILSGTGVSAQSPKAPAKTNGKSKPAASKASSAKTAAKAKSADSGAKKAAPKTGGAANKSTETVSKVQAARAQK